MTDPSAPSRAYRIGIDVGGTFTKAVLIDNASHEVVGRFSVLTTHSDPRGVAKGVVDVFRNVLEQSGVDPKEVIFLAHSTTQATNALLEGDVAKRRRDRHVDPRGIAAGQKPERHETDRTRARPPYETDKPFSHEGDADR